MSVVLRPAFASGEGRNALLCYAIRKNPYRVGNHIFKNICPERTATVTAAHFWLSVSMGDVAFARASRVGIVTHRPQTGKRCV